MISLSELGLAGTDAELLERDGVDATSTGRDRLLHDDSSLSLKVIKIVIKRIFIQL